ncbi:hypothetical protein Mapa_013709 [Marchantia paleacea]|nr:hypothetical protein Mapa_013709 [Marchantia paleacea]
MTGLSDRRSGGEIIPWTQTGEDDSSCMTSLKMAFSGSTRTWRTTSSQSSRQIKSLPTAAQTFGSLTARRIQNDKHVGCFFNVTSCTRDDDPVRKEQIVRKSLGFRGASWDSLLKTQITGQGGMTILRDFLYRNEKAKDPWRAPKTRLWNELLAHGSAGVHNRTSKLALSALRDGQVDFAMMSMVSAWMMSRTSVSVKKIAHHIMAKYADSNGRPLWRPPVIAMHIRQTDKMMEDPYFRAHGKYRGVRDYIDLMKTMETKHTFEWQSVFIISDSGTAIDSFARVLNGVGMGRAPDSMNGRDGKRFVMYDWSWDDKLIERTGGHLKIPPAMKFAAQEHFLATLYIIHKIADYAYVSYSSNVGRFVGELVGARHRLAMELPLGPNAYSWDSAIGF